jgi:hypothetical protein
MQELQVCQRTESDFHAYEAGMVPTKGAPCPFAILRCVKLTSVESDSGNVASGAYDTQYPRLIQFASNNTKLPLEEQLSPENVQ